MEKSGGGNALETKGTGGHRGDGYTRSGLVPKEPGLLRKVQCNRTMKKVQAGVEVENVSRAVELKEHGQDGRGPSSPGSPGHISCPTWLWTSFHLLCSCPKALTDSHYLLHYNQVLKAVAESLASAISTSKHHHALKKTVSFVNAGEKPTHKQQAFSTQPCTSSCWSLLKHHSGQTRASPLRPQNICA